ncbi:MAG: hypothetical protein AB8H86_26625 [Polyangiales bacterium]
MNRPCDAASERRAIQRVKQSGVPMRSAIWLSVLCLSLGACGAVNRQIILEEREDPGDMMAAIHAACVARGFDARLREERQVSFHLDRELGTRLFFQAKRRGVVLVVRAAGGEEVAPEQTESELQRAEVLGREIMREAHVVYARMQQEEAERERAEAIEDERRAQQRAQDREANQANQARLRDFMEGNRRRNEANRVGFDAEPEPTTQPAAVDHAGGGSSRSSGGSSARCCINGAYYECPNAAALDQCAGRFARCVSACGMSCMEECLQSDPPDPSSCTRVTGRDGECS